MIGEASGGGTARTLLQMGGASAVLVLIERLREQVDSLTSEVAGLRATPKATTAAASRAKPKARRRRKTR